MWDFIVSKVFTSVVMSRIKLFVTVMFYFLSITQIYTQTKEQFMSISPKREMRGIWVATVNNIDWPSQPGLSVKRLKEETLKILSRVKTVGLNTVFLQVRPSSDAIYKSEIEPLTSYMVGETPYKYVDFDALQFWIEQAHAMGLELHAWINPFRVTPKPDFIRSSNHLSYKQPDWIVNYAGKQYLNPGLPESRAYVANIVADITSRYDIDGIHFDDYFYPYPVKNETFDDKETYLRHNTSNLSLDDWRRDNVNKVIKQINDTIKTIKPWVAFGVSPFGVWRNKSDDERGSNTRAGITNYDILYADVAKWIDSGWIDYVVPQIYWASGNKAADFDELYKWWANYSNAKSQVFVGHAIFKVNSGSKEWNNPEEMPSQIDKVRANERLGGSVFFSYRQFNRDLLGLESMMQEALYRNKALSPLVMSGVNRSNEKTRLKHIKQKGNKLSWKCLNEDVRFFAIYRYESDDDFEGNENQYLYDIVGENELLLAQSEKKKKYIYRIAVIDKYRSEYALSKKIVIKH